MHGKGAKFHENQARENKKNKDCTASSQEELQLDLLVFRVVEKTFPRKLSEDEYR